MKTLAGTIALLVVLGLCLPSHGEILVYKLTQSGTYWMQEGGEWDVKKGSWKAYVILDLNYDDYSITQAEAISYETSREGKRFQQEAIENLELVRVASAGKVQWIIMGREIDLSGEEITGGQLYMMAGQARSRNVGAEENREVPNKLTGYDLQDQTDDGSRDIGMTTLSFTLYPAWTYWANGDEGNQSLDATTQMIKDYLIGKGYTEESK